MNVTVDMDEMDITSAESKATYEEIKKYVAEHNDGMKVSSLNIAQVKAKYIMRISRDSVILDNGGQVPLARGKYDQINRAYIERN